MNNNDKPIVEESEVINLADILNPNTSAKDKTEKETEEFLNQIKGEAPKKPDYFNLDKDEEEAISLQEEVEVIIPPVTEEPLLEETLDPKEDTNESQLYKKTLRKLYGDKVNTVIEESEEGEDIETALEDVIVTEEIFSQIVDYQEGVKKEELLKDKISVKGVSNFAQEMFEIDRMGGDITGLLKTKETVSDPLEALDLTEIEDQEKAVMLLENVRGTAPHKISALLRIYKEEGTLETEALEAKNVLKKAIEDQVVKQKEVAQKEQDSKEESLKFYKKAIKEEFDKVDIDDSRKIKMVVSSTKRKDNGRFEIDDKYAAVRNNPEEAMWLTIFLEDRKLYNKLINKDSVVETQLKTASRIRTANKQTTSTTLDQQRNRSAGETLDLTKI